MNKDELYDVEKYTTIYKGGKHPDTGAFCEDLLFTKGTRVGVADAWVNAKSPRTAINKLLSYLNLPICKYQEDFEDNCYWGYYFVEEANFYAEDVDTTYKYYCKVIYDL